MANTTIVLRKSGTPGASPSSLANGELALNYADGKLYYKSNTGSILAISGSGGGGSLYSFATINANSSLILATSSTDTLSIIPGNNVTITANTTTKSITIDALTGLNSYDFGFISDPIIATSFDFGSVTS
jgi:pyruvate/2-oxoglutarate dehydrogenase complex dihydrolipoamide acyltransferase (E2) component